MSKGSSGRTTTTRQIPVIPDYLQTAQTEAFQAARDFSPEVFQGDRFVPVSDLERQQISALTDFGQGPGVISDLEGAIGNIVQGGIGAPTLLQQQFDQDLGSSYLDRVIDDRISDVRDNLTSQFSRAGRLGSDAFGTALGRGIGTAVAPILAQRDFDEAQRRDRLAGAITDAERQAAELQLRAGTVAPTAQDLQLQRLQGLGQAAALERAGATLPIDAEQQRIAEQNLADQARLNALLSAAGINLGAGTETTSIAPRQGIGSSLLGLGSLASGFGDIGVTVPSIANFITGRG